MQDLKLQFFSYLTAWDKNILRKGFLLTEEFEQIAQELIDDGIIRERELAVDIDFKMYVLTSSGEEHLNNYPNNNV